MKNKFAAIILLAFAMSGTAAAQRLPDHYPEKFQRTGIVDDVQNGVVVVNDMPFTLADSVVVHSTQTSNVSIARLRRGVVIAYRLGGHRQIVEIWLLPSTYKDPRERR